MTDRELMQQALEALECLDALQPEPDYYPEDYMEARKTTAALRERLAQPQRTHWEGCEEVHPECRKPEQDGRCQRCGGAGCAACDARHLPEQEPVAWVTGWHDGHCVIRAANPGAILPIGIALYTAPPRRWVGLTEADMPDGEDPMYDDPLFIAGMVWAANKLQEKNA